MFIRITEATYLHDFILRLTFSNGVTKDVDLEQELYGEIFSPLKEMALFQSVRVNPDTGTIEWPNGADFAPEFLFESGQEVRRSA
jgi:hypothetical protein